MRNVIAKVRSLPKRTSGLIAMIAAAIIVPASLLAWGPERATYTIEQPADHVTFNSITNNPNIGDERNFVGIREKGSTGLWQDSQTVEKGKEYVVRMYVHNNAAENLNLVAENVTAMFNLPTTTGKSIKVTGFLSASNAQPNEVYDHATFTGSADFNLAYVPGTLLYENNAPGAGFSIPESVFTSNGAKLGYNQMDGKIPGCFQYDGYLTFVVKPQFAPETPVQDFTMQKLVSKHGENKWVESYNAQPGETVDFLLEYKNTGGVQQNNVTFSDKLPANLSYVAGSTVFGNSKLPNGAPASDNIANGTGVNVGHYAPGANAWLIFSAKVASADKLECGTNTLKNWASVTPEGQTQKEDDATVTVPKECQPPVETHPKVEVDKKVEGVEHKTVGVNTEYTYQIVVKNTGDVDLKDVVVTDKAPQGVTFLSASAGTITSGEWKHTIAELKVGASASFTIKAKVPTYVAGTIKNTVCVDAPAVPGNPDDCDDATVDVPAPEPEKIEVCDLDGKTIITIDKDDFDSSKHSTNLDDCKEKPAPIKVCDLTTKEIVTIDEKDFDSTKHSKNLDDCKEAPAPEAIKVCRLADKQIITIQKNQYDAKLHSYSLDDCKEVPAPVKELPQTGLTSDIASLVGAGSLIAASAYYVASRRSLGQ